MLVFKEVLLMDIFNLIFIVVMILGFFIIIISLIQLNKFNSKKEISFESSINNVKGTLNNSSSSLEDINFMSEEMFKQFEQKQKELINIYEAIEKKRGNNISTNTNIKNRIRHPMLPKIQELMEQNYSIPEIAKILNIGQGELKFIIELGMD